MKKLIISSVVVSCMLFFAAVSANAYPNQLDFVGHVDFDGNEMSWSVLDSDSTLLSPSDPETYWDGVITGWDPTGDVVFDDVGFEYIKMADLTIDVGSKETSSVFGIDATKYTFTPETYEFNPNTNDGGFALYDDDDTLLFSADLIPVELLIVGTGVDVNPSFKASLTNIKRGASYSYGTSGIIDAFLDAPAGSWNISSQFGSADLVDIIDNGGKENFSYSGIADPVPEPATILLFGAGLLGLAAYGRKKGLGRA